MKYAQESLFEYMSRTKDLREVLCSAREIPDTGVFNFITKSFTPVPLYDAHIYTGVVRNVRLFKRKYFLTSDCRIIAEGVTHSDYFINWPGFDESGLGQGSLLVASNAVLDIPEDPAEQLIDERVIFIGGDTIVEPNWAHWFFEHLLKLRALELSGVDLKIPIVVSHRLPKRFLAWGNLLAGRELNWLPIDLNKTLRFREAWVSSCPAYKDRQRNPHLWRDGFMHLRNTLGVANPQTSRQQATLFSRQSSKFRRAINEEDLFAIANSLLSAKKVSLGDLRVDQQLAVARQTSTAIFFGGADGPMSLFMPGNSKVLEVTAPQHGAFFTCVAFLALTRGSYIRLVAERFIGDYQGAHPLNRDYIVNREAFFDIVKEIAVRK